MEKNELLAILREAAQNGQISREEANATFNNQPALLKSRINFSEAVQYVGAGVVFIGIATLIAKNWTAIGSAGRILLTFGMAMIAFAAGLLLLRLKKEQTVRLGYVFLLISILLMPIGVFTIFDAFGLGLTSYAETFAYELCLTAIYGAAWYALKSKLYIVPVTIFLTTMFFTLTNWIIGADHLYGSFLIKFYEYRFLVTGISYLLIGFSYTQKQDRLFALLFYFFGIIGALGSIIALGGYQPSNIDQILWEIAAPIIMFGAIYFSIFVKHTSILIITVLFLMGYVIKISTEYFGNSFGWPVALTIAGLLLIAVGYLTVYLNNKYIKPEKTV